MLAWFDRAPRPRRLLARLGELLKHFLLAIDHGFRHHRIVSLSSRQPAPSSIEDLVRGLHDLWRIIEHLSDGGLQAVDRCALPHAQIDLLISADPPVWLVSNDFVSGNDWESFLDFLDSEGRKYNQFSRQECEVIQLALDAIANQTDAEVVVSKPRWFIPWYEVKIDESSRLGKGGFGTVYRAKWLDSDVVVKRMNSWGAWELERSPDVSLASSCSSGSFRDLDSSVISSLSLSHEGSLELNTLDRYFSPHSSGSSHLSRGEDETAVTAAEAVDKGPLGLALHRLKSMLRSAVSADDMSSRHSQVPSSAVSSGLRGIFAHTSSGEDEKSPALPDPSNSTQGYSFGNVKKRNNDMPLKSFLREADVWFNLNHPHVVRLYGACHIGDPFFACEYASNGSLSDYLRAHPDQIWSKLYESALGVGYIHARGVVHGDLKCNNIVVGGDGKAKVTDFGLSALVDEETDEDEPIRISDAWQWVGPECLDGARPTRESDIYSFGMCIIEALRVVEGSRRRLSEAEFPRYPWGRKKNSAVKVMVTRLGRLPKRLPSCAKRHWELVTSMCKSDPGDRITLDAVVNQLGTFRQMAKTEAAATTLDEASAGRDPCEIPGTEDSDRRIFAHDDTNRMLEFVYEGNQHRTRPTSNKETHSSSIVLSMPNSGLVADAPSSLQPSMTHPRSHTLGGMPLHTHGPARPLRSSIEDGRAAPRIAKWIRSNKCYECEEPFNWFVRRHHRRMCGNSFCHEHSSRRLSVFGIGFDDEPVRVCDACFADYNTAAQDPSDPVNHDSSVANHTPLSTSSRMNTIRASGSRQDLPRGG